MGSQGSAAFMRAGGPALESKKGILKAGPGKDRNDGGGGRRGGGVVFSHNPLGGQESSQGPANRKSLHSALGSIQSRGIWG